MLLSGHLHSFFDVAFIYLLFLLKLAESMRSIVVEFLTHALDVACSSVVVVLVVVAAVVMMVVVVVVVF